MRYCHLKTSENDQLSYKKLLDQVLGADIKLNTKQFSRMSKFYQDFESYDDDDVMPIEDQDYEVLKKKLDVYCENLRGIAIKLPEISEFLEYLQDLPKTDPKEKGEKPIDLKSRKPSSS